MSMDHKQSNDKENKLKGKKGSGTYPEGGLDGMILRDSGSKKTEYPLPEPSAIQITDPLNTARVELITTRAPPDTKISSPQDVEELMKGMGDYDRERLKVIHLDTKNQVLAIENIAEGVLNAVILHPRETVKGAILSNAASVIIVHNHPSGDPKPSKEDIQVSQNMANAFFMMRMDVLDFLIVTKTGFYSFMDEGIMPSPQEPILNALDETLNEGGSEECKLAYRAAREVLSENCGN